MPPDPLSTEAGPAPSARLLLAGRLPPAAPPSPDPSTPHLSHGAGLHPLPLHQRFLFGLQCLLAPLMCAYRWILCSDQSPTAGRVSRDWLGFPGPLPASPGDFLWCLLCVSTERSCSLHLQVKCMKAMALLQSYSYSHIASATQVS